MDGHESAELVVPQGFEGLAGLSLCTSTHVATPAMAAAPIPIARGELSAPPPAAGAAPAARFLFFFLSLLSLLSDWPEDSSRVVSWPCASKTVPFSSVIDKSPLRAAIRTVPSTSLTLKSVHAFEAGETFTSPAVVVTPLEVEMLTPPCSIRRELP